MVLGLKYGHCVKGDTESKQRADFVNDRFLDEFAKRNGSYICNDLLGCDVRTMEGVNYAVKTACSPSSARRWCSLLSKSWRIS